MKEGGLKKDAKGHSWKLRLKNIMKKNYPLYTVSKIFLMIFRELPNLFSLAFLLPQRTDSSLKKFLILGQTRSGTHLLRDLLNIHPDVHCEQELFDQDIPRLFLPEVFVEGKRNAFKMQSFGFILHLRHILMMKNLEQDEFLSQLHNNGWHIIHLHRNNVLRQQISLEIGKQRGLWHSNSENTIPVQKYQIDPADLLRRVRLREIKAKLETEILAKCPHLSIVYEDDLLNTEMHQSTLDRVFDFLQLPSVPVTTALARTSRDSLQDMILNYPELESAVTSAGYGEFLIQPSIASGENT